MASVSKRLIIITFVINLFKKIALTNVNPHIQTHPTKTGIFWTIRRHNDLYILYYCSLVLTYLDPSNTVWWGRLQEQHSPIGLWCREKILRQYNGGSFTNHTNPFLMPSTTRPARVKPIYKNQRATATHTGQHKRCNRRIGPLEKMTWPHLVILQSGLLPQTNFLSTKSIFLLADASVKRKMAVNGNLEYVQVPHITHELFCILHPLPCVTKKQILCKQSHLKKWLNQHYQDKQGMCPIQYISQCINIYTTHAKKPCNTSSWSVDGTTQKGQD